MKENSDTVVLVADDEPSTLALVVEHVRAKGFKVIEASDGDMAWQLAHQHLPDLVILDVMMPGMSGWEVCRKIRESLPLAHTGVIMLTGIGQNLNEMTSPLYGADTHVDKPFEFADLDAKIDFTLNERRQGTYGRADKADEVESARNPQDRPTKPSFVDEAPVTAPTGARIFAKARATTPQNETSETAREAKANDKRTRKASGKRAPAKKTAKSGAKKATPKQKAGRALSRARKPSSKKVGKKSAAKQKTAAKSKQASVKKSSANKASVKKKASAKKGSTKKSAAKKAPVKKSPSRKAAPEARRR